jgi:hypothetical protein
MRTFRAAAFGPAVAACALGGLATLAVRGHMAWVPWWYPSALLVGGTAVVAALRHRTPLVAAAAAVALIAALPVPWETTHAGTAGSAWRMDGRMSMDGQTVDPPGRWLWLTVGRPLTVAELVAGRRDPAGSVRGGQRLASRPAHNEAAAAVVGLRAAGIDVVTAATIEMSRPLREGLPSLLQVASLDGTAVTTVLQWQSLLAARGPESLLVALDGTVVDVSHDLGYRLIDIIERPDFDVVVGGRLAHTPPGRWWRNRSAGGSHGMLVALAAYAHASGADLARGRTIAGTGAITADGTLRPIGGLRHKATAAMRAGADVLVFPAMQAGELEGFDAGGMRLLAAHDLDGVISGLMRP